MATFTPMAQTQTSPTLQRYLAQLMQGSPRTIGSGIDNAAKSIVGGLAIGQGRREAAESLEAQLAAALNIPGLVEQPGVLPAGGGMGPPTAPTPGLFPRETIEALHATGMLPDMLGEFMAHQMPVSPVDRARLDMQREGLGLDREGLELRKRQHETDRAFQERKLALEQQELEQAGVPEPLKASEIRNMRLDYREDSAPFVGLATNYEKLASALASETGEGDIAAIFSFMKALDPTSTVREGEQATTQNSAGALQGLWNTYNQVLSGQRLAGPQRQNFLNVAGNWLAQARDRQLTFEQQHTRQAELAEVDPARVVPDLIGKYRDWSPVEAGGRTPLQNAGSGIVDTIVRGARDVLGLDPKPDAQPGGESFDDLVRRYGGG